MTRISGKTAFITGAASGIGLAISKVLARSGANVMLADIEAAALQSAREEVRKYSVEKGAEGDVEVGSVVVDVTDRESMADALETVKAAFGSVELLFNNAGVNAAGALDEVSYEDWDWVLGVNLGGVINGVATFLPELKRHGSEAHMVNTASVGGLVGMRGLGVYNASKFAVVGLSEALRADMESYGVGVSVLCPGVVEPAWPPANGIVHRICAARTRKRPKRRSRVTRQRRISARIRWIWPNRFASPLKVTSSTSVPIPSSAKSSPSAVPLLPAHSKETPTR